MLVKTHSLWNDLSDVHNEFDRFFRSGFGEGATGYYPPANISETDEAYVVQARIPGLAHEDVAVELENRVLTISGEHRREEAKYGREERASGKFKRTFTFKKPLEADAISAHVAGGVLTVTLPKAAESKPRKISVVAK